MIINPFFEKISNCGILETDSVQEKLNKRILCITSFLITIAGFIWGIMYFQLNLYIPAIFPIVYSFIVGLTIIWFSKYKNFKVFVNIQLLLNNKKAFYWLIAYMCLAFISVAQNYYYPTLENPKWMRLLFFSTNILAVSLLSFLLCYILSLNQKKNLSANQS